jgi:signal peptidase I
MKTNWSYKLSKDWILTIAIIISIILLLNTKLVFYKITVPSESMYPTIKKGDKLVVTTVYNTDTLKRGDIIVFYSQERNETLVKRLIGLPGDTVEIKNSTRILINGKETPEPYVVNKGDQLGNFKVPEGKYLFMGDNRQTSLDSRMWVDPYIDKKDIKGKARFIFYPFNRFGKFVIGQ